MKTKVESLDDLKAERARLSNEVQLSQVHIRKDLGLIKREIRPAHQAVNIVGNFLKNRNTGVLGMGINFAADHLLRRTLLARANPVVRWVVPVLFRNLAGSLLAETSQKVGGQLTDTAEKALLWVKEKTADPQPKAGTLQIQAPKSIVPPRKPGKPLAWKGLDVAEKLVRWVKTKTDDKPQMVQVVTERRVRPSARTTTDITPVEYLD